MVVKLQGSHCSPLKPEVTLNFIMECEADMVPSLPVGLEFAKRQAFQLPEVLAYLTAKRELEHLREQARKALVTFEKEAKEAYAKRWEEDRANAVKAVEKVVAEFMAVTNASPKSCLQIAPAVFGLMDNPQNTTADPTSEYGLSSNSSARA